MTTLRDQEGSKVDRHQGVKSGPSLTTLPDSSQLAGCSTCQPEEFKQLDDAIPSEFDTSVGPGSARE